jgi:integrase
MGSVFKRNGSKYWHIKYYKNGKSYQESTKTEKIEVAKRILKLREGEISQGKLPGICFERIKFDELIDDLITDYKVNSRKSINRAEQSTAHLLNFFGGMKSTQVTTAKVKEYIQKRMEDKAKPATINRELAALKRAFSLGAKSTPPKVAQIPYIPMLKENNTRTGFFEHEDYINLLATLPSYLSPVISFAYRTGWRKSEILGLTWGRVDLREGLVRLDAGDTKNDEGRTVYLDPELRDILKEQLKVRRLGFPYVFHREGERISGFRKSWISACEKAKLGDRLFHDFRRTAIRNLVRSGVPERVAMMISGHKTRSVFERYNVVSPDDLKQAALRQGAYLRGLEDHSQVKTGAV